MISFILLFLKIFLLIFREKAETPKGSDEESGKITKSTDVSLETRAEIIHTLISPVTIYRCESWTVRTVKKDDKKNQFI